MRLPRLLRKLTDPLTERLPVPIASGPNRGKWWSLVSAGSGYATGRRAHEQMSLLAQLIAPGDIVWDVGAHHGYVVLHAAERVGPFGQVHAFEPSARNARILRRHVRWNRLENVVIHNIALAAYTGRARFGGGVTSKMHTLGSGHENVVVDCAENMVRSGAVPTPTFVKIDVEGSEAEVLRGALPVLRSDVVILAAIHSPVSYQECVVLLRNRGFEVVPSPALELALHGSWRGDPDLLCIGPDYERKVNTISWPQRSPKRQ
jgi:FkbM family methyltransferase